MKCVLCKRLCVRNERKMANFWARTHVWQSSQANDWAIWERDPLKEQMKEAITAFNVDANAGFRRVLALAEQGSVWNMLQVANFYLHGVGIRRDPDVAEEWWRRAFEGGSERAQLYYGKSLWMRGDYAKCEEVFSVGAAKDWAPALYWLARCRLRRCDNPETLREVRPMLELASEKGSLAARYLLARRMLRGRFGLREIPRGWRLMSGVIHTICGDEPIKAGLPSPLTKFQSASASAR